MWVYRQRNRETGGIIEPSDWLVDQNELAAGFNGMLDRDNIPTTALVETRFATEAFNNLLDSGSAAGWTANNGTTEWHHDDGAGASLPVVSRYWAHDSLLICEFSCHHRWGYTGDPANGQRVGCRIYYRIVVDGVVVDESGPISGIHSRGGIYLVGATPIVAGQHDVRVQVRNSYFSSSATHVPLGADTLTWGPTTVTVLDRELVVMQRKR